MKRLLFTIMLCFSVLSGLAQNKSLEFYYIAHDRSTPVNDLCARLEEIYEIAMSYDDYAVVFYLPNANEPIIIKMNLPGDNRAEFRNLISDLRLKSFHEIYADLDRETITELFNTYDFIDESGNRTYSSVLWCWYVNPDFWQFKYNETLIAALYFNFEIEKYTDYVSVQIWHAAEDGIQVDADWPFGTKNLCADMYFMLQQY